MHAVENMSYFLTSTSALDSLAALSSRGASGKCWRCRAGWELSGCWRPPHMRSDSYLHDTERFLPVTLEQSQKTAQTAQTLTGRPLWAYNSMQTDA